MKLLVFAVLAVGICTAADPNAIHESDDINDIISDPLDPSYYGLPEKDDVEWQNEDNDDEDETIEPLGDIEDAIVEVLDNINDEDNEIVEEVIVEEEEDDDEDEQDNEMKNEDGNRMNKKRKHKLWKKHGRKITRKAVRYMKKNNIDDISEVPKRKFKGPFKRMHKLASKNEGTENEGLVGKGPRKRIYRKITKHVHKKLNHDDNGISKNFHGICARITKRTEPRKGMMKKLPETVKSPFLAMFEERRKQLLTCCEMENEEQRTCFVEVHKKKIESICTLVDLTKQSDQSNIIIKHWQKKAHCCDHTDDMVKEGCFRKTTKIMRQKHKRQKKMNPEIRLARTCKRVNKPVKETFHKKWFSKIEDNDLHSWKQVFEERRKQMTLCCGKDNIEDKMECAKQLQKKRIDSVCAGDEDFKPKPKAKAKHETLVETCCEKEGDDRYSCFSERRFMKKKFLHQSSENESQEEEETIIDVETDIEEVDIEEDSNENKVDEEDSNYDADYYQYNSDEYDDLKTVDNILMDRMMGDAPVINDQSNPNEDREAPGPGRRQQRKEKRQEARQSGRECCQAGRQAGSELPDGEEDEAVTQQCESKAQTFVENREAHKNLCLNVYQRCCSRGSQGDNRRAMRLERRQSRKEQRKSDRKVDRQRMRQERRQQRQQDKQE